MGLTDSRFFKYRNARIGPTRHARTEGTRVFLVGLVLRFGYVAVGRLSLFPSGEVSDKLDIRPPRIYTLVYIYR